MADSTASMAIKPAGTIPTHAAEAIVAAEQAPAAAETAGVEPAACCDGRTVAACCEPSAKTACCGETWSLDETARPPASCGCR